MSTGTAKITNELDDEDIHDINMAATTIKKRSDGLLVFVKDYRTISNVPIPQIQPVNVKKFLSEIEVLMSSNAKEAEFEINILPITANASIKIDIKLI